MSADKNAEMALSHLSITVFVHFWGQPPGIADGLFCNFCRSAALTIAEGAGALISWEFSMKTLYLGLIAALAMPSAGHAAAFINGDFELGTSPGGTFVTFAAPSTGITGWTVTTGSIDYIGGYWQAGDGARSVDLSGNGAGAIAQTFDTVAGLAYSVNFLIAGNPDGPGLKTLQVAATGNAAADYGFDSTGHSLAGMGWAGRVYNFTATGASTTLSFSSLTGTVYGPALDGVSVAVTAIPEPAVWALMIGGLALVGMQMRRRGTAVAFA
jgi:choice-of-anchor C domain-containing protein